MQLDAGSIRHDAEARADAEAEAAQAGGDGERAGGGGLAVLVARIQSGERAAEDELVTRFSRGLLLLVRRLGGGPALADDLHQETFALVIEKVRRGEVREPERLAGFIRATARNLFIADRRKAARNLSLDAADAGSGEGDRRPAADRLADRGPEPLERALAAEEARRVRRLLGELRFDRDRQVLVRFYLSDASKEEICQALEIEPERFNQVLHRARERLREIWERVARSSTHQRLATTRGAPA
jgi:RNA polymerase sigma-70 factor (ECF subfamily)